MKKYLTPMNILTIFVLAFFLYQKIPLWINANQIKGTLISPKQVTTITTSLKSSEQLFFPNSNHNTIAIFWASWCGPCKIEMERLKKSVEQNKIDSKRIFAINPFEDEVIIRRFLKENPYPFNFINYEQELNVLNISMTPTTVFFKKNKIEKTESGMSLIGIWSAENFLK